MANLASLGPPSLYDLQLVREVSSRRRRCPPSSSFPPNDGQETQTGGFLWVVPGEAIGHVSILGSVIHPLPSLKFLFLVSCVPHISHALPR